MKIAVIIPDRNDRPELLKNCLRMVQNQTLKPEHIELVNFKPTSNQPDITARYRIGYEKLKNMGFDVIALMENDDWYAPNYLETMVEYWIKNRMPDIFGTDYTIYYHLRFHKWFTMNHKRRSSAMSTLIKPDLNIKWCPDNEVYTDIFLWQYIKNRVTFHPKNHVCIGMKHGMGLCGGRNHTSRLDRYSHNNGMDLLISNLDAQSFNFYSKYYDTQNS